MPEEKLPEADEDLEKLAALAFEELERERAQPIAVTRRRISDKVFLTLDLAGHYTRELASSEQGTHLKGDLLIPYHVQDENKPVMVSVPSDAAVILGTTAQAAYNWKAFEADPKNIVRKTIAELSAQIASSTDSDALVKTHRAWLGILRALAIDVTSHRGENVRQMQEWLDPGVSDSDGDFMVDVQTDPALQIQAIAEGIMNRMRELCTNDRQTVMREMRSWTKWLDKGRLKTAAPEQMEDIANIYRDVEIPMDWLEELDPRLNSPDKRLSATERIQQFGGFILRCDPEAIREGFEKGRILTAIDDDDNLLAYYEILNDQQTVEKYMKDELCIHPSREYRFGRHLPTFKKRRNRKKGTLKSMLWTNEDLALATIEAMRQKKLIWSVDMAVRRRGRKAQVATACKLENYHWAHEEGFTHVIMKILEITAVGNQQQKRINDYKSIVLPSPVPNIGSFHMNEIIGARRICVVKERRRIGGMLVEMTWHYLVNPLELSERYRQATMSSIADQN